MLNSILILGAYGKGNIGDELLRWVTVKIFETYFPNITGEIFTYNQKVSYDFFNHDNFSFLNYYDYFPSFKYPASFLKFSARNYSKRHQLIVFGGGGFIYDYSAINILSWLRRIYALKRLWKPILLLGIGIGPIRTGFSRLAAKLIINLSDIVIVRDYDSFDLAKSLSKDKNKIKLGADLAILLNKFDNYSSEASAEKIRNCLVIPRQWPYHYSKKHEGLLIDAFSELITFAIKNFNIESVNFLPLHRFDDMPLCQRIAQELNIKGGVYKVRKYEDIKSIITNTDLIISMRYHGVMLSLIANKPVIAIAYDRKINSLMKEFFEKDSAINWNDFINIRKSEFTRSFDILSTNQMIAVPDKIKEMQNRLLSSINAAINSLIIY